MKKYSFSLETVRRVKKVQEEIKKAALAKANLELRQANENVYKKTEAYEQIVTSNTLEPITVEVFMKNNYSSKLAKDSLIIAQNDQKTTEQKTEQSHQEWTNSAIDVKVLDRLDEKRRIEHALEFNKDQEKLTDDVVTGRFKKQQRNDQ